MYGVKIENNENKYIILTVFISLENQHQGIGKMLIQKIEEYASQIHTVELLTPASIYDCEFYKKIGYDYYNGIKELNEDGEYVLSKHITNK